MSLQAFVAFAGSPYTFGITIMLIVGWAIAGAYVAGNALWQITIQVWTPRSNMLACFLRLLQIQHAQQSSFLSSLAC